MLPADGHVHSEWSWDALEGSMERTCARAVAVGLPVVAFTDHADFIAWTVTASDYDERLHALLGTDGSLTPPELDLEGYLEAVERCRDMFPGLRILTGVELGEPHWNDEAAKIVDAGRFDRVLGSLHGLPVGQQYLEPPELYKRRPAAEVLRDYLAELPRLIEGSDVFSVLAHIDYPIRMWPAQADPFDPEDFVEEFRHALRALARSGRALEVNTAVPLHPQIVRWWRDVGGRAVTFGSDAHVPAELAHGFAEASAMVQAHGFRPGRHPCDFWSRSAPLHR